MPEFLGTIIGFVGLYVMYKFFNMVEENKSLKAEAFQANKDKELQEKMMKLKLKYPEGNIRVESNIESSLHVKQSPSKIKIESNLAITKVECPTCKSSGQIDSLRIPDSGINATCRQCNNKFLVRKNVNNEREAFIPMCVSKMC